MATNNGVAALFATPGSAVPFATPGGSAVNQLPGFPEEWRDEPLNPNGTLAPVNPRNPYSLQWLQRWRVRQLYVETDLLYQFANKVAGMTGRPADQYFRGGATAVDALESLMVNVVTSSLHRETAPLFAEKLPESDEDKAAYIRQRDNSIRELLPVVRAGVTRDALLAGYSRSTFRVPESTPTMDAAIKRQQEVMFSSALQRLADKDKREAAAKAVAAGAPRVTAPPKEMVAPAVASGTRAPLLAATVSSSSSQARADMQHPPPPPQVYRVLSAEETSAQARAAALQQQQTQQQKTAAEATINPRLVLTYLLMRGGITETERKTVAQIFGPHDLLLHDPEHDRQVLKDMEQLERLLRRTGSNTEFLNAPQHTGVLFFTPRMTSAVSEAVDTVHHTCNKPTALEIDLMTHEEVRTPFAKLVAYHMKAAERSRMPRFGGSAKSHAAREDEEDYAALVALFRSLRYVQERDAQTNESRTVLSFTRVRYGQTERAKRELEREQYMEKHGRYYTDARQLRPLNPDDFMK